MIKPVTDRQSLENLQDKTRAVGKRNPIEWNFSTWGKRFCFADYAKGKFLGGRRKIFIRLQTH